MAVERVVESEEGASPPLGAGWKIRVCALCAQREVYVHQEELQQYCRRTQRCLQAPTMEAVRYLPLQWEYIRVVPVYEGSSEGSEVSGMGTRVERAGEAANVESGSDREPPGVEEDSGTAPDTEAIPYAEIEAVERTEDTDDAQYGVQRIRGNKIGPCQYLVCWMDGTSSWELVTRLFGAAEGIIGYWRSPTGHQRARNFALRRQVEGSDTKLDVWKYSDWSVRVLRDGNLAKREVLYLVAVQLTATRHRTQKALKDQLRKGDFSEDALFTVWVVPRQLSTVEGSVVVPLLDVRYSVLRHLVNTAEWKAMKGGLVRFYGRLSLDAVVPLFWWHSQEQDDQWGLQRDGVTDSVTMASILRA
jgi:hypothetical protein